MIIVKCEQGTEEWFQSRCGSISASHFKDARSKMKQNRGGKKVGDWTMAAEHYAYKIAVERIIGEPLLSDTFTAYATERGKALEPQARALHALKIGHPIQEIGLAKTDDERFSASPDGLIGDDGGSEYKSLYAPSSLVPIFFNNDISEFEDQVQGGMWICDREWWDFVVYCPQLKMIGLEFNRKRVYRDQQYINALENDLEDFDVLVEQTKARLIQLGIDGWCDSNA